MKKITYLFTFIVLTVFISCKNDSKSDPYNKDDNKVMTNSDSNSNETTKSDSDTNTSNTETEDTTTTTTTTNSGDDDNNERDKREYHVQADSTFVKWTAYKTTSKVGVGGLFKTIKFENRKGGSIAEAYNNLEFTIPVSSMTTNDEVRDQTLFKSFFGVLVDTKNITGKLTFDKDDLCTASITMNGVTKEVPLHYFAGESEIDFTADINLEDWDATGAVESINKVCEQLHKGADGISKTWSEVAIHITTKY